MLRRRNCFQQEHSCEVQWVVRLGWLETGDSPFHEETSEALNKLKFFFRLQSWHPRTLSKLILTTNCKHERFCRLISHAHARKLLMPLGSHFVCNSCLKQFSFSGRTFQIRAFRFEIKQLVEQDSGYSLYDISLDDNTKLLYSSNYCRVNGITLSTSCLTIIIVTLSIHNGN